MKKKLSFVFFFISFFSFATIAQQVPESFKRINGKGSCESATEIRVYYDVLPPHLPVIAEIRADQSDIHVVMRSIDVSEFAKKGYVSFCITCAEIIPAAKLWIRFHYENPAFDVWVTESKVKNN